MPSAFAFIGGGLLQGIGKGLVLNGVAKRERALRKIEQEGAQKRALELEGVRQEGRRGLLDAGNTAAMERLELNIGSREKLAREAAKSRERLASEATASRQGIAAAANASREGIAVAGNPNREGIASRTDASREWVASIGASSPWRFTRRLAERQMSMSGIICGACFSGRLVSQNTL